MIWLEISFIYLAFSFLVLSSSNRPMSANSFRWTQSAVRMDLVLVLRHPRRTTVITAKWRDKQMISISIICQFGATVNMVSSWVHTDKKQAAAVVSQNNRRHVRSPEEADAMLEAFLSYRHRQDVSEELMWKHIHHKLSCGCSEEANDSRVPWAFIHRTELEQYPTTQVKGEGCFSCAMQVNDKMGYGLDMQAYYKSETTWVMCCKT